MAGESASYEVVVVAVDDERGIVRCLRLDGPGEVEVAGDWIVGEPARLACGTLTDEGDGQRLLELGGEVALDCEVRVKGSEAAPSVALHHRDLGKAGVLVSPADLGLPADRKELQKTQGERYLYRPGGSRHRGAWDVPGGDVAAVLARRAVQEEAAAAARNQRETREHATSDDVFVNPYTFVPLPAGEGACLRTSPPGHHRLAPGRLAGSITMRWTARTPLLVRTPAEASGVQRAPRRRDEVVLPGSGLKGAVRSLHETLAGGCLRVVDLDFVPGYRDTATARDESWTLARVVDVDGDGCPLDVELCDRVVWVEAAVLHATVGGPEGLRTGTTVELEAGDIVHHEHFGRDELRDGAAVGPGDGWVVLVTDAGARRPTYPYHCAVGRLSGDFVEVDDEVWRAYLAAVDGADDVRVAQQGRGRADEAGFCEVRFAGKLVGYRGTVGRAMGPGDIVWVRRRGDRVVGLARAAIWRHEGKGPIGERVDEQWRPCRDAAALCPSCSIFGAADDQVGTIDRGAAEQQGYRGHVRIGDGRPVGTITVEEVGLAPMGAPRAGAGQFYLRNHHLEAAASERQPPTREWGAAPDRHELRPIAGRKHYWHADPGLQSTPRHLRRTHHSDSMGGRAELISTGSTFESVVRFENLTSAQLGGLLAALDPAQVLDGVAPPGFGERCIRPRLGGGRPFGLGSVEVEVVDVVVHDAHSRYGSGQPPAVEIEELVAEFVASVPPPVRETWPDLAAVLDVGHVNPERVWYPPGTTWDQAGSKSFDRAYDWFDRVSGKHTNDGDRRMVPLASPRDLDQYLPIIPSQRQR